MDSQDCNSQPEELQPGNVLILGAVEPITFDTPTVSTEGSVTLIFVPDSQDVYRHIVSGHPIYLSHPHF